MSRGVVPPSLFLSFFCDNTIRQTYRTWVQKTGRHAFHRTILEWTSEIQACLALARWAYLLYESTDDPETEYMEIRAFWAILRLLQRAKGGLKVYDCTIYDLLRCRLSHLFLPVFLNDPNIDRHIWNSWRPSPTPSEPKGHIMVVHFNYCKIVHDEWTAQLIDTTYQSNSFPAEFVWYECRKHKLTQSILALVRSRHPKDVPKSILNDVYNPYMQDPITSLIRYEVETPFCRFLPQELERLWMRWFPGQVRWCLNFILDFLCENDACKRQRWTSAIIQSSSNDKP